MSGMMPTSAIACREGKIIEIKRSEVLCS